MVNDNMIQLKENATPPTRADINITIDGLNKIASAKIQKPTKSSFENKINNKVFEFLNNSKKVNIDEIDTSGLSSRNKNSFYNNLNNYIELHKEQLFFYYNAIKGENAGLFFEILEGREDFNDEDKRFIEGKFEKYFLNKKINLKGLYYDFLNAINKNNSNQKKYKLSFKSSKDANYNILRIDLIKLNKEGAKNE